MSLSEHEKKVVAQLSKDEWKGQRALHTSIQSLKNIVRLGFAERRFKAVQGREYRLLNKD